MAKDRLGDLRQVSTNSEDVSIKIETASNDNPNSKNNLRTTFERAEVIGQWITEMETNVEMIKQMICNLDISLKHIDINTKIDNCFQNNTSISNRINAKLKEMGEELSTVNSDTAEGRIKSIQYNTIKSRYVQIFKNNNAELEGYKNIQKDRLEAQLKAKGVKVTDEELVALLDKKEDIQIFTENQDLVDRVEWQAHVAKEYVGRTPEILNDAVKKKRRYLKCKIIAIVSLIIVAILIVLMLFS